MKESKNIAVVCNYHLKPERVGGMDRFFWAYNDALTEKGHKVSWFFSGGEVFGHYNNFLIHLAREQDLGVTILKSKTEFDIVVTHFVALCTPFFKTLKEKIKPFIIVVDHNPRPIEGFSFKKRMKNKIKGKLYGGYIDRFVGVSQYTVECILNDFGQHLKNKTSLVYNGIDSSVYDIRKEKNFGKMIVASHLRESKGIGDLIEAVNLLPSNLISLLKVDIYGEGPLANNLKTAVVSYNLNANLSFCGSSPNLPLLIKEYSFMLQPTYMECFSLSILESLAANVPVVTTPVGGNPEVIVDGINGYLFEPGNIAQLSKILKKILTAELKIDNRVDQNIKDNFTLHKMVAEHINLLPCT